MKILYGLYSGMVLQRQGDLCRIRFAAEADGTVTVTVPHGRLEEIETVEGGRHFWLTGIPVGGPYTLTLSDDTDSVTLHDLYVGDVWLLAGQSNMEGVGYYRDIAGEVRLRPELRQFSFDNQHWESAEPRLHRGWLSPEPYMREHFAGHGGVHERGVGPGFFFAEEMYRRTGVPQGLIPCALGGSNLGQWSPDGSVDGYRLYDMTLTRFRLCGAHVRGIFWYQGCAEANPDGIRLFTGRMKRLVEQFREDTGCPELPFVQVQIGRFTNTPPAEDSHWSAVRELQRCLTADIPHLDTVAVTNADYADGIHLQARYHIKLGAAAAESMYALCFDPQHRRSLPAPALRSIRMVRDADDFGETLAVAFDHIHGGLTAEGIPSGFALSHAPERIDTHSIFRIELSGDTAYIRHECPEAELRKMVLSYYFGNGSYANITDAAGRPLPAFGPLKLSEWLTE